MYAFARVKLPKHHRSSLGPSLTTFSILNPILNYPQTTFPLYYCCPHTQASPSSSFNTTQPQLTIKTQHHLQHHLQHNQPIQPSIIIIIITFLNINPPQHHPKSTNPKNLLPLPQLLKLLLSLLFCTASAAAGPFTGCQSRCDRQSSLLVQSRSQGNFRDRD